MYRAVTAMLAAILLAASLSCTHGDSRARDEARQAAQEAKDEARRSAEEARQEAKEAGREAAAEGRAAADEARRSADEARREADEARREGLAEAADARREAQDQASEARREAADERQQQRSQARGTSRDDRHHDSNDSGRVVNLNSASAQDISAATGLTSEVAQKIVAARPFVSKRDLVGKRIVDEQTYWKIQKHVTVMSK